MIDTPENYYAILGVPTNADSAVIKGAYRQLALRYHPDLVGPEGAIEMKRINRAYAVLSDPEKRQQYNTIIGGVIDLRKQGFVRPRPDPQRGEDADAFEFSGLNIFGTKGPFQAGPVIHSSLGVISVLSSVYTVPGLLIAAGSLDGKVITWQLVDDHVHATKNFAIDPAFTVEALRELRFSAAGSLLAGWNRLSLHVWDGYSGERLWSYPLQQRAVSAHYSLDVALQVMPNTQWLAVARGDSEINEGVIDLWSVATGQIVQKFYHPWQISALHFADKHCIVGLTDGTVQVWQQ